MKKLFILTIVLVLLAVSVVPALASGGGQSGGQTGGQSGAQTGGQPDGNNRQERHTRSGGSQKQAGMMPFALAGTIVSLDSGAGTVTVAVASGNTLVQSVIGQDVALQTTGTTRFLMRNPGSATTPITFADLAVGQKVSAVGQLVDNVWTATRITVGASLVHQP